VRFARTRDIPYLGICLGLQIAVIEFARHVAGLDNAQSTEFDPDSKNPVVALVTEWTETDGNLVERDEADDLGGTMRLGAQAATLRPGSLCARVYGRDEIQERHRHRYEVNNTYRTQLEEQGLRVAGLSNDDLVEMIELPEHPWFVACQFHPEFKSTPRDGHPLFSAYISAALRNRNKNALKRPEAVNA